MSIFFGKTPPLKNPTNKDQPPHTTTTHHDQPHTHPPLTLHFRLQPSSFLPGQPVRSFFFSLASSNDPKFRICRTITSIHFFPAVFVQVVRFFFFFGQFCFRFWFSNQRSCFLFLFCLKPSASGPGLNVLFVNHHVFNFIRFHFRSP